MRRDKTHKFWKHILGKCISESVFSKSRFCKSGFSESVILTKVYFLMCIFWTCIFRSCVSKSGFSESVFSESVCFQKCIYEIVFFKSALDQCYHIFGAFARLLHCFPNKIERHLILFGFYCMRFHPAHLPATKGWERKSNLIFPPACKYDQQPKTGGVCSPELSKYHKKCISQTKTWTYMIWDKV